MQPGVQAASQAGLELVTRWEGYLLGLNKKPSTLKHYPRVAREWVSFLAARSRRYDQADADDVDAFLELLAKLGRSGRTRRGATSILRRFYIFLKRRSYVTDNPFDCLEPITVDPSDPNPLTEDQARRIIEGEPDAMYRALWEVFYATGQRITPIHDLRVQDVNLAEAAVYFHTGKRGKVRRLKVGRPALEALGRFLEIRAKTLEALGLACAWLWIRPDGLDRIHQDSIRDHLAATARRVGITERVHPHRWRHSTATHMLDRGADLRAVQEQLGHGSIQATQIYTLVSPKRLEETFRKAHPRA